MPHRPSRRLVASVGALAAVTITVAGCSGGDGSADNSGGPVTVTFAASTLGDPGRGPGLQELIDEFNDSQSEVKVEPASVPYPTFGQTVLTQLGGGEGPDLIRFDMPEFEAAASAGLLEPLDERLDVDALDLLAGPDEYMTVDDQRYGVIFEASNYALFYNADLIPEPPTTFDEFVDVAQATTSGEVYGLAFRQTQAEEAGVWQDIFNYVYGFGGAWSDGENLTLNTPEVIEGLEAYQQLYDAEVIPQGADAATFRKMFAQDKVGMELNNGGYAVATKNDNPELNFDVVRIPFPVESQGSLLAPIVINTNSDHKDEAMAFIDWLLEDDQQTALQSVLGASSVATATERSAEDLEEEPYLEVFDELTESGVPQVVLGFGAETPDIRQIVVTEVLSALQGQQDMKTAMDNAQEQATALVGG